MRVASGPDNGGTYWDYRTVRVRLARSEGVARANQWLKLRKQLAGSNLVDTGQCAVRDVSVHGRRVNSEAGFLFRWGGHAEGLRRRRGDAAGVELGTSLTHRLRGERGNHPRSPQPPGIQHGGGQARCRLMAVGWGGGPVVVAGVTTRRGGRESRPQGQGGQQVSSRDAGMPGGRR